MKPRRAVAAALLGVFAGAAWAQDKLAVRLDWTPWGIHAAIHLAAEKGWFKQNGIDATVEDGNRAGIWDTPGTRCSSRWGASRWLC